MKKPRHTTEQIIEKLRQADVALGKGQKVPEICKSLQTTEQTYYRWRQKYGGMAPEMTKQLRVLEKENARLKKLVAELMGHSDTTMVSRVYQHLAKNLDHMRASALKAVGQSASPPAATS